MKHLLLIYLILLGFLGSNAAVAATYYTKSTATTLSISDATARAQWGTNTDGTGTAPTNSTWTGHTWIIANNATVTTNANVTLPNLEISNGSQLTITSSGTCTITSSGGFLILNGTLIYNNSTSWNSTIFNGATETIASGSTFEIRTVNTGVTMPANVLSWGNIKFASSSSHSTHQLGFPDNLVINGDFTIDGNSTNKYRLVSATNRDITFKGNVNIVSGELEANSSGGTNLNLTFEKSLSFGADAFYSTTAGPVTWIFTGTNSTFSYGGFDLSSANTENDEDVRTNITIESGATLELQDGFEVSSSRTFTVNGTLKTPADVEISGSGNFTLASTGTFETKHTGGFRTSSANGTVLVSGTRTWNVAAKYILSGAANQQAGFAQYPTTGGDVLIGQLTIANTTGTVTLDADLEVSGPVTINAGSSLTCNDGDNIKKGTGGTVVIIGTVVTKDADGFAGGASSGCTFTNYSSGDFSLASTSTVDYNGSTQAVTSFTNYGNLTTSASGNKTLNGDITIAGNLTLTSGTLVYSGRTVTLQGLFTATSGTITDNTSSTFVVGGSAAKLNWPLATTLSGNLTLNRSNGMQLGANLGITGTLALTSGNLEINGQTLTISGSTTGTTSIVGSSTSNLTISGSSGTLSAFTTPTVLNNLTVNATVSKPLVLTGSLQVAGNFNASNSGSVTVGNNTLRIGAAFSSTTTAPFTLVAGSSIVIDGTAGQLSWPTAVTSLTAGTLELSRSNGLAISANLSVQNLTLTSGDFTFDSRTLTINGNYIRTAGEFDGNSNAVLSLQGSGTVSGAIVFDQAGTNNRVDQLIVNRSSGGEFVLGSTLLVQGGSNNLVDIQSGTFDASTFQLGGGTTNLTMTGGTLKLGRLGVTLPDFGGTYTISGGTIELNGAGSQTLLGGRGYSNLTFSGSGTKSVSSSISGSNWITGTVTITGAAILDVGIVTFGGNYSGIGAPNTNFTMTGGEFRTSSTTVAQPAMEGTYSLSAGKVTLNSQSGTSQMTLRGLRTYNDVEINATTANYRTGANEAGNVIHGSGTITINGAFVVKSPAVYAMGTDPVSGPGTFTVESGAGLIYGNANGIKLTGTGASDGNIRTTTRSFSSSANYGVRGSANMVTGDALPASIPNFIIGKTGTSTLSFSSPVTVTSNLHVSGGSASGTNLTIGTGAVITRTAGSFSSAPIFAGVVDINYNSTTGSIAVGPEMPTSTSALRSVQINNPSGITSTSNYTVNGNVTFSTGHWIASTGTITLSPSSSLENETATSYLQGLVQTTHSVGTGASVFGRLGYELKSGTDNLGNVTVLRQAGSGAALSGMGNNSVLRNYDITITGVQPSSGRDFTFRWFSAEDNGKDFSTKGAAVFRRDNPSSPWVRLRLGNKWMPVTISGTERAIFSRTYHFSQYTVTDEDAPLPVLLGRFEGKAVKSDNYLNWTTTFEANNKGFRLERSFDGNAFEQIAFVSGTNKPTGSQYQFTDPQVNKVAYYRLIQEDFDGTLSMLPTVIVNRSVKEQLPQLTLYPNPTKGIVKVSLTQPVTITEVKVWNSVGQVVKTASTADELDVHDIPTGTYHVTIILVDGTQLSTRLIKE